MAILPELMLAPALAGAALVAARRWGAAIGGLCSSFPAIVGPLLLITARAHGAIFAARAANAILLGLAGLAVFAVVYSWVAGRARWWLSLAAGWLAVAPAALAVERLGAPLAFPGGLIVAVSALLLAAAALPPATGAAAAVAIPWASSEILGRMLLTAVLVGSLAAAAETFGPVVGGVLAGLPALTSVLVVCVHTREGPSAAAAFLRGVLSGLAGFVGFCAVVAVLIVPAGVPAAFAAASATAVGLQAFALARHPARIRAPVGSSTSV